MTNILLRVTAAIGGDEAVFYALLTRSWRAVGGLVSLLLIAKHLTPETQGFFYTFQSLIALQTFVELGLFVVIINVASHEWASLRLNEQGLIVGDPDALSRLVSFGRKLASWYGVAALVFLLSVAPAGIVFLGQKEASEDWFLPWCLAVLFQAVFLCTTPFQALYEGCNQVAASQRFQLWQSMFMNVVLWGALASGCGLWSFTAFIMAQAVSMVYFLGVHCRLFFLPFLKSAAGSQINWRLEVWPMQWRLAVQGIVNFFVYSLYTPVIFYYHGAVQAGQFGMTWQVFTVLQGVGLAWVQTRIPRFGILIAQRNFPGLDQLWRQSTMLAITVFALGMGAFLLFQVVATFFEVEFSRRLLPVEVIWLLFPTGVLAIWVQCAAAYWRAHKEEPLGFSAALPGVLNGVLVWWGGQVFGASGAIAAYLTMLSLVSAPLSLYLMSKASRKYQLQPAAN